MNTRAKTTGQWFVTAGYSAILIIFGVIIGGALLSARHIRESLGSMNVEIGRRETTAADLAALQEKIKLIDLQVSDYDRLVSPNQDLGEFLKQLNEARDAVGLRDVTISMMSATARNRSVELPIAIRGTGTFPQFHDFLCRLEKLKRMSSVKHLSVEAADPAMNGKVTIELTMSIYNTKS